MNPIITGMKKAAAHLSVARTASTVIKTSATLRTCMGTRSRTCDGSSGSADIGAGAGAGAGASGGTGDGAGGADSWCSGWLIVSCSGGQSLAHRTELAPRHRQQVVDAIEAHGPAFAFFRVVVLLQRAHGALGHQRVAVHPQELRGVP